MRTHNQNLIRAKNGKNEGAHDKNESRAPLLKPFFIQSAPQKRQPKKKPNNSLSLSSIYL